jgi:hypothetical protein
MQIDKLMIVASGNEAILLILIVQVSDEISLAGFRKLIFMEPTQVFHGVIVASHPCTFFIIIEQLS